MHVHWDVLQYMYLLSQFVCRSGKLDLPKYHGETQRAIHRRDAQRQCAVAAFIPSTICYECHD